MGGRSSVVKWRGHSFHGYGIDLEWEPCVGARFAHGVANVPVFQ